MASAKRQVTNLLFAPLPELNPPGFDPSRLAGLRALPGSCNELKLIYGLRALEPLAERPATAHVEALLLAVRILSAVGVVVSRIPTLTLTDCRFAASLALNRLRPGNEETPTVQADLLRNPGVLQLLSAEMIWIHDAEIVGQSEEIVRCAAGMVLELWEFADQLRRCPGKCAGEMIHESGWANAATAKILRKLALGSAVVGVVQRNTAGAPARPATPG
ncbi:MAG: hypothetical protein GY835_08905 [bacterium]|nr:hypothetical protein [bacterium]